MSETFVRRAWLVLGFGWLALVAWLSLVQRPPGAGLIPTDVGHFVAYAWMTSWFAQLRSDAAGRWWIAIALSGYGVLMEVLQGFTQARQPSLLDVAVNTSGIAAGALLMRTRLEHALERIVRVVAPPQRE